jgi:ComF family protein
LKKEFFLLISQKKEGIQKILHSIKYQNQKKLAVFIAEQMARKLGIDFFKNIDVLIPVPLHPKKQKIRGYNQASLIAQGINNVFSLPVNTTTLTRAQFTDSQTTKNRLDRWKNVQGAFELKNKEVLSKKHVLLLDDVFTTGATLEACIKTLQKGIDCKCSILTLVRA